MTRPQRDRVTPGSEPVVGSVCTGYGGLDLGVLAALGGARIAWFADPDPHIAQILQARLPDVPNLGDVRLVDWAAVEPVDLLVAGFPCQDISAAGARVSRKAPAVACGPTSWPAFAYYDQRSSSWRTSPRFAGKAEVFTVYSATWPKQGMTRSGVASAPPTSAQRTGENACSCSPGTAPPPKRMLPTPQARDGDHRGPADPARRRAQGHQVSLHDAVDAYVTFSTALLPTPTASDTNQSTRRTHQGGPTLSDQARLLPTPTAADARSAAIQTVLNPGRPTPAGCVTLTDSVRLLPTPRATDTGTAGRKAGHGFRPPLSQQVLPLIGEQERLLPTPRATDGTKDCPAQRGSKGDLMLSSTVLCLVTSAIEADDIS